MRLLIEELTSQSLQSKEALFHVASYFDIPHKEIKDPSEKLSNVFVARNQIVHEMDIDFTQKKRNRRSRSVETMQNHTQEIFLVSKAFLRGVDSRIAP